VIWSEGYVIRRSEELVKIAGLGKFGRIAVRVAEGLLKLNV
jgi:hypothetical protein